MIKSSVLDDAGLVDALQLFPDTGQGGMARLAERLRQTASHQAIDHQRFAARKHHWLRLLEALYQRIEQEWFSELIRSGAIVIDRKTISINEEHIGPYQAPMLDLQIGDHVAQLIPKGTLVIGAAGRVDLEGPGGRVVLVLESEEETPADRPFEQRAFSWHIATRTPRMMTVPLDADRFADALAQVMDL